MTPGPAGASRRPHSRFACNAGESGRIRSSSDLGVFESFSPRHAATIVALGAWLFASACGGSTQAPAKGADDSEANAEDGASGASPAADDGASGDPGPTGPDCSDQTCFACGASMCPVGFYCDEKANGGPACGWLPECAETASCACVTGVLGSSCSCDDGAGGPHVACE
ncbi:MAG TPA: hypothetical protein VI197_19055 [Polyangiaceae bacterium]